MTSYQTISSVHQICALCGEAIRLGTIHSAACGADGVIRRYHAECWEAREGRAMGKESGDE